MIVLRFFGILLLTGSLMAQIAPPFTRGVNLTNWFQYNSAQQVQFTRYTFDDFQDIQSLGVDVIRLPISLHDMTSGAPDYTVDPLLFFFLDQIVDWTEALDLHLILDNHSFDPAVNTEMGVYNILIAVWPQMAEHFKARGPNLYYEILNEPHGISDIAWNTIQLNVVSAIRAVDTTHTIVVGPADWNSYNNLDEMPIYPDDNLIYTYHFYDPFIFTHQGASWADPSMVPLSGVPFPYGAGTMPVCPPALVGTWIQNELNNYVNTGTVASIQNIMDIAVEFGISRGVPIFCGEFGAYIPNAINSHRVEYYREVVSYFDSLDVAWTMWDYHGGFGLFESGSSGLFDHDLNIPLVEAMGFNVPEQTPYLALPDSANIQLYQDYIMAGIRADHSISGELNTFYDSSPKSGEFCIRWTGGSQYDHIGFKFAPHRDLSYLLSENYVLTFWIKPLGNPANLDFRFIDTKTAIPEDHPWRMVYSMSAGELNWNGEWQYVQIPFDEMSEGGSWDNAWYSPQGLFDWSAIQDLEIVAENAPLGSAEFHFDDIRIVDQNTAALELANQIPRSVKMSQNYPNPFNPSTTIEFSIAKAGFVQLNIYDLSGRHLDTLVSEKKETGDYAVKWDVSRSAVEAGIYFAKMDNGGQSEVIKMVLLK
jgi:endoglucanase